MVNSVVNSYNAQLTRLACCLGIETMYKHVNPYGATVYPYYEQVDDDNIKIIISSVGINNPNSELDYMGTFLSTVYQTSIFGNGVSMFVGALLHVHISKNWLRVYILSLRQTLFCVTIIFGSFYFLTLLSAPDCDVATLTQLKINKIDKKFNFMFFIMHYIFVYLIWQCIVYYIYY